MNNKSKNLDWFEEIYNKEFYTKYAVDGKTHIKNRFKSIYTQSKEEHQHIYQTI